MNKHSMRWLSKVDVANGLAVVGDLVEYDGRRWYVAQPYTDLRGVDRVRLNPVVGVKSVCVNASNVSLVDDEVVL